MITATLQALKPQKFEHRHAVLDRIAVRCLAAFLGVVNDAKVHLLGRLRWLRAARG